MPDDAPLDQSDPTAAMNQFGGMDTSAPQPSTIDPYAADAYAGLQWPPPSWGITSPATQPPPTGFDAAPGVVGDPAALTPVAPAPAAPEPVLPPNALTPDRAPTDTTGSAPINVDEALTDGGPDGKAVARKSEETDLSRLRQQYAADPLNPEAAKYLTPQERGASLAGMSPQQYAAYMISKQDEKAERDRAEQSRLERENHAAEEREFQAQMAARAATREQQVKLNADIAATLKEKNPSWMESRSTGQKIAAALSAIVGGLSMGAGTGYHGPNLGMQMMEKAADDYNTNMRQQQEQKRALLGQEQSSLQSQSQADMQDFHDRTVHRIAQYESAKQALLTEQQKYDPQGTTSVRIGEAVRGIEQQQAVAQQQYAQKSFDNNVKLMGAQHQQAELAQKIKQDAAGNALRGYEISTTRRGQDLSQKEAEARIALEREKLTAADKDKADKLKQESGFGVFPTTVTDTAGKPTGVAYKAILQADGKEWIPQGKPEDVAKLRDKSVAVKDLTQIMDNVQRLRTGWSNSVKDREEYQRMQAEWSIAKVAFKDYAKLGALSESDYDLLNSALGTSDPSKFLDQSAGIKESRGALVRSLNNSMRAHGYDNPKDFQLPDTSELNIPQKDAIDMLGASINAQPAGQHDAKAVASAMKAPEGLDQLYKIASGEGLDGKDPGTVQMREFYADPEKRAKALQYLKEASENAPLEKVKDEATKLYNSIIGPPGGAGTDAVPLGGVHTVTRIGDE